jgi:hypothetical protein
MRPLEAVTAAQERTAVRAALPAISVAHHDDDEDPAAAAATLMEKAEEEEEEPPTPYSLYASVPASAASSPRAIASHFVFPASSSAYQFSAAAAAPALCLSPNEISRC